MCSDAARLLIRSFRLCCSCRSIGPLHRFCLQAPLGRRSIELGRSSEHMAEQAGIHNHDTRTHNDNHM